MVKDRDLNAAENLHRAGLARIYAPVCRHHAYRQAGAGVDLSACGHAQAGMTALFHNRDVMRQPAWMKQEAKEVS